MNRLSHAGGLFNNLTGVLFAILSLIELYLVKNDSISSNNILLLLNIIAYILCIHTWYINTGRLSSLFVVFILYSLFSNLGQSVSKLFGWQMLSHNIYVDFSLGDICYMLRFQLACIAFLNVGAILYFGFCKSIISRNNLITWSDKDIKPILSDSKLHILTIVFNVMAIWVISYCVWQILQRRSMSYIELFESRDTLSTIPQYGFVLCGLILVFCKRHTKFVYFGWVVTTFLLFIAGTRSMAIIYVGVLIAMVPVTHYKLFNKRYALAWIVGFFFSFALISVTSAARTTALGSGNFEFNLAQNLTSSMSELGASAKPILYTINSIQNGGTHNQTILYTLLHGFLPTRMMDMLGLTKWNIHLASWVTDYSGITYTELGYSFIAEAYMDFGNMGWLFMCVYGMFIAFAENTAYSRLLRGSLLYPAIFILLLSKQLFFARANFELIDTFYRYSVYIFFAWILYSAYRNNGKVRFSAREEKI